MSFGFRKNFNTTPKKLKKLIKGENAKKKQDKCNNMCTGDTGAVKAGEDEVGNSTNESEVHTRTVIDTNNKTNTTNTINKDDNGNAGKIINFIL